MAWESIGSSVKSEMKIFLDIYKEMFPMEMIMGEIKSREKRLMSIMGERAEVEDEWKLSHKDHLNERAKKEHYPNDEPCVRCGFTKCSVANQEVISRIFFWAYENDIDVSLFSTKFGIGGPVLKMPSLTFSRQGRNFQIVADDIEDLKLKMRHYYKQIAMELCCTPLTL